MPSKRFSFLRKILYREKEKNKDINLKTRDDNPWEKKPTKTKIENEASFRYFMRDSLGTLGDKIGSTFDYLGKTKINIHFFLRIKRVYFAGLFFLYAILSLMSLANPIFFVLFSSSAYLALDYLWKTRRYYLTRKKNEA